MTTTSNGDESNQHEIDDDVVDVFEVLGENVMIINDMYLSPVMIKKSRISKNATSESVLSKDNDGSSGDQNDYLSYYRLNKGQGAPNDLAAANRTFWIIYFVYALKRYKTGVSSEQLDAVEAFFKSSEADESDVIVDPKTGKCVSVPNVLYSIFDRDVVNLNKAYRQADKEDDRRSFISFIKYIFLFGGFALVCLSSWTDYVRYSGIVETVSTLNSKKSQK